ncbi:unnamed protein product, partial [Allacma fusca]
NCTVNYEDIKALFLNSVPKFRAGRKADRPINCRIRRFLNLQRTVGSLEDPPNRRISIP